MRGRNGPEEEKLLRCADDRNTAAEALYFDASATHLESLSSAGIDTVGGHKRYQCGERDADTGRYMDTPADDGSLHLPTVTCVVERIL